MLHPDRSSQPDLDSIAKTAEPGVCEHLVDSEHDPSPGGYVQRSMVHVWIRQPEECRSAAGPAIAGHFSSDPERAGELGDDDLLDPSKELGDSERLGGVRRQAYSADDTKTGER